MPVKDLILILFFFNDTATTEIYTLSLHDALPISKRVPGRSERAGHQAGSCGRRGDIGHTRRARPDRKSTRLNSSHGYISYAVFCLKKNTRNTARSESRSGGRRRTSI